MSNNFYHDGAVVSGIVGDALNKIDNYETIVKDIQALVNRINGSDDWIDVAVKTAYIEKCNGYISLCNAFIKALRDYVNNYLAEKSAEIERIEGAYS